MQGETRAVPKRTSWLGGWRAATLLMAAFLVGAMTSGGAYAQRNYPPTVTLAASTTAIGIGGSAAFAA